jgi:hypothetical protein
VGENASRPREPGGRALTYVRLRAAARLVESGRLPAGSRSDPDRTVFTLRYARLYYSGQVGGIDFNETDEPDYRDFAYLSFTIGMTFQVSDTNIQSKQIRRTALRHAWLAFPLGVVIIATTINLVAGLAK